MILPIIMVWALHSPVAQLGQPRLSVLKAFFQEQQSRLSHTPSIWPAHGYVTSEFGARIDPYTTRWNLHPGLDISGGSKNVYATADGVVVHASWEGEYGNMVAVDHGHNLKTNYGHLSKILVKNGEIVHRGQLLGFIGTTGRSTGPHLHYEVRIKDVAVNPRQFILDD